MTEKQQMLDDLRRRRDEAARIGDLAEALILNDRIQDLKEGRSSATVECVMKQFESGLARRRAYGKPSEH